MNYKKHYDLLIERSKNRVLEGYVEKHHIIPKCLGGTDDKENLAILTPEEHFLAHQLLIKLNPRHRGLIYAVQMMTNHHTDVRINNKLFGWIRRRMALAMSEQTRTYIKENGHPRGMLGKKHTSEKKLQIAASTKAAMIADRGVAVYTYNLDGTFCKSYATLTDCADDLQTSPSNIKYTADGNFGHCKGKQIRYQLCEQIDPYVRVKVKTYIRTEEHKKYIGEKTRNNKAVCNHCGMKTTKTNINRWHNNNCKHKNKGI
jgi:hypothetical protein